MKNFSPTEAILFGWNTFKANIGFFLGLMGIIIGFQVIATAFIPDVKTEVNNLSDLGSIFKGTSIYSVIGWLILSLVTLGVIKALLNLVDTGKGNFADGLIPFKQPKILVNYILAMILLFILISIITVIIGIIIFITFGLGFVLVIPLAIFLNVRLSLFTYFIVDKGVNPIEAFMLSWNATKGNFWNLLGFYFLCVGIIISGVLLLLVGLLAAIPVVMIATIYVYRKLAGGKDVPDAAPAVPTEPVPAVPATPEPAAPAMPQT